MRARYYDPQTGRFIGEDTARSGSNWYAYCDNNSINFTDATGHDKVSGIGWFIAELIALLSTLGGMVTSAEKNAQFRLIAYAWAACIGDSALMFVLSKAGAVHSEGISIGIGGACVVLMAGLLGGVGKKGAINPLSVGDFYKGYASMLAATAAILDLEVAASTGEHIWSQF